VGPALAWSEKLSVQVSGAGTVASGGVVLPRLLADRLGLCAGLAEVMARSGFLPLRHRGRALVDAACSLAAGATCLSDIEAMTAQEEIFGPGGGASDTTMLRVFDELAGRLRADGLPGRRLARATRGRAGEGVGGHRGPARAVAGGSGRPEGPDPPGCAGVRALCTRYTTALYQIHAELVGWLVRHRPSPTFLDKLIYSSFPLFRMGAGAGWVYYPCQRLGA